MRHLRAIFGTIVVALVLTTSFLIVLAAVPETVSAYTAHDPIFIDGDSEFTSANGVTGGSGTASDPYIIEGWEIDANSSDGIRVLNAESSFIIRHCYVYNGRSSVEPPWFDGIHLSDCGDARIENNSGEYNIIDVHLERCPGSIVANNTDPDGVVLPNSEYGIFASECSGARISSNSITGMYGIYSEGNDVLVERNTCGGSECCIVISGTNVTVSANNVSTSASIGIKFDSSTESRVTNNTVGGGGNIWAVSCQRLEFEGNSGRIDLQSCEGVSVYRNTGEVHLLSCQSCVVVNNTCSDWPDGILLSHSDNNTLSDNDCSGTYYGIRLDSSCNNTLSSNDCSGNQRGIALNSSNHNTLADNNCSWNSYGILLDSSCNNTLSYNTCSSSLWGHGMLLLSSSSNTLSDNDCSYGSTGIELGSSSNNTLSGNNCSHNFGGIRLFFSSNDNTLDRNNCSSNNDGISIASSGNNTVSNNNASSNNAWGIYIANSAGTTVYHNAFFNNTHHADDDGGSENSWNASYPTGGNYWDDYTGVDEYGGPDQDQPGPDGIGDTPYEIDADSIDYYPLMAPPDTPPTASFTVSPPTGDVTTLFSFDASGSWDVDDQSGLLEVRWDFDGDGEWDTDWTTNKTATHQYAAPGIYDVRLEVRDTDGLTGNATATVEVVEAIPEFGSVLVPVLSLLLVVALLAWRRRARER